MASVMYMKIFLALYSCNVTSEHQSLDAIKCKTHPDFIKFEILKKCVLEGRKHSMKTEVRYFSELMKGTLLILVPQI
jgi:hypothetical protein